MTLDTDTEARAAAEAYAQAWSEPQNQAWVIEAFLAGRAHGLEEAAGIAWANRWEPPYSIENRIVDAIRAAASSAAKQGQGEGK